MRVKITANMVTMLRILLLPVPCALLMSSNQVAVWVALVIFILLGMTDFVDGAMARRDGPTRLGGLIDPVADKIFVAAITFALVGIKVLPVWFIILIFLRELLMTMLRTSVALRQESIKTSFLGKFKTIIQMGGIGTIFLTVFGHKLAMQIFSFSLFVALLLLGVFLGLKNKKWPAYWIFPVSGTFLYWFLLLSFFSSSNAVWLQMLVIVAITWISAFDYLYETYRIFLQTGFHMWDFARLLWAFSFCLGVLPFIDSPGIVIFILISISFELALGGVDNVVATEQAYAGNKPFFVSSLMSVLFLGIMLLNQMNTQLVNPMVLAGSLAFSSAVIFFLTYRQWRQLFARVLD